MLDTYRLIIDSSETFSPASGRPMPLETVDRMLQSATLGAQMFESLKLQQSTPPDPRPPVDRDVEESREGTNGSAKRHVFVFPFVFASWNL